MDFEDRLGGLDCIHLHEKGPLVCFCEHGSECSGSVKRG
jgi:hypothetical protein